MAIYCLSVQIWFVTSIQALISSIIDFKLPHELPNNLNIVSREIRKYLKNLGTAWGHGPVFSLPSRNSFLQIVFKNYAKADIKVCCSCLIFLHFFNFCQIFLGYQYFHTNFSENCLTFPEFFSFISLTFYDFRPTKRQETP